MLALTLKAFYKRSQGCNKKRRRLTQIPGELFTLARPSLPRTISTAELGFSTFSTVLDNSLNNMGYQGAQTPNGLPLNFSCQFLGCHLSSHYGDVYPIVRFKNIGPEFIA